MSKFMPKILGRKCLISLYKLPWPGLTQKCIPHPIPKILWKICPYPSFCPVWSRESQGFRLLHTSLLQTFVKVQINHIYGWDPLERDMACLDKPEVHPNFHRGGYDFFLTLILSAIKKKKNKKVAPPNWERPTVSDTWFPGKFVGKSRCEINSTKELKTQGATCQGRGEGHFLLINHLLINHYAATAHTVNLAPVC